MAECPGLRHGALLCTGASHSLYEHTGNSCTPPLPTSTQPQLSNCLLRSISTLTCQTHTTPHPALGNLLFQRFPPPSTVASGTEEPSPRTQVLVSCSHASCQQIPSTHLQDTHASLTSQKIHFMSILQVADIGIQPKQIQREFSLLKERG